MNKQPTINDVAKLANVSKSTVSKYLNNIPYVSSTTRKKIEKAIKELDYYPSSVARGLVSKSINLIALVISDIELLNNFLLIKTIEREANKYGYDIVLVTTNDEERVEQNLNEILSERYKHVDGIILANARQNGVDLENLKQNFEHIVLVHRYIPNNVVDHVSIDNYLGGKLVAEYLIRMGHRQFAIISGPTEIYPYKDRTRGFTETLLEHDFNNNLTVIEEGQSLESAYQATEKLMTCPTPPTSIFATSDLLAFGVLDAAKDYGWNIPQEISLVGFDNVFFSRLARVPLTTIDGQFETLGKKAVELLIGRMNNKNKDIQHIFLQPSLIVRESCINLN